MNAPAHTTYLKDYRPPAFLIPEVALDIDLLGEDDARVEGRLTVRRYPQATEPHPALTLDLDEVTVESVAIDGQLLPGERWSVGERHLVVRDVPDAFSLTTVSRIHP